MSFANQENPYEMSQQYGAFSVAQSDAEVRSEFIRKTYLHLGLAVCAFVAIEAIIFALVPAERMVQLVGQMFSAPMMWLLVVGAFIGVSFVANKWAMSNTSRQMQYAGLFLYVIAEALIFVPILAIAQMPRFADLNVLPTAGIITGLIFGGLTAIVFLTKADFSFLRYGLMIAGLGALGVVVCSMIFGFSLGIWFSVAMIVFAAGYILYDTSNVMHHYRPEQYVAASLALFASVATLFYYVLSLLMKLQSRD